MKAFWLKHRLLVITVIIFATIYALISFVNHYYFRTYALDLGLYTQALFKYAHFELADSTMINEYHEALLGGHFDLYLILFSPLIYIFNSYTLLVVQLIMVIVGGVGVYRFIEFRNEMRGMQGVKPIFGTIYFYLFFGVFSAVSFDYHSVVVASCIVPWFFIAVYRKQVKQSLLLLILILIAQENVALWMTFVCLGLLIEFRKDISQRKMMTWFTLISITYFFLVISIIIPSFSINNSYKGFLYSALGQTPIEAIQTVLLNPIESFKLLFINHTNALYGDFVKTEFHLFILFSGGYLLVRKPLYILMLVPLYAQKLFHDNYLMWSFGGQYVIEFAPILAIGVFEILACVKRNRLKNILVVLLFVGTLFSTIRMMDNPVMHIEKRRFRLYKYEHYTQDYDVNYVYNWLKEIPTDAKVSALSPFVPHLSIRHSIYQFPIINDATYIVYAKMENPYPMSKEEFEHITSELEQSDEWEIISNSEDFIVLKKQTRCN